MSWVKQQKLPAVEAICFQGQPCNNLPDLWRVLHQFYNVVANHSIDLSILNEITSQATHSWVPFSLLEMQKVLKAYSNISALGPDHITWWYLKHILSNNSCAVGILFLANVCLSLHHCIFWTGGLVYNTYLVQASWAKGLKTSIIAFDIA